MEGELFKLSARNAQSMTRVVVLVSCFLGYLASVQQL